VGGRLGGGGGGAALLLLRWAAGFGACCWLLLLLMVHALPQALHVVEACNQFLQHTDMG
jgi:hypothetical protein